MASRWLPSVCRQYKVLSWGSSHSMTHFLSAKREIPTGLGTLLTQQLLNNQT